MKSNTSKIIIIILTIIFAFSAIMVIMQLLRYKSGIDTYNDAEEIAGVSEVDEMEISLPEEEEEEIVEEPEKDEIAYYSDAYSSQLNNVDIDLLRETNSEVLGWIMIPETELSYPLLQTGDNEHYLYYDWEGTESVMGSIFLECQSNPDMTDFNTIVYGHRMKNGSMFATLKYYNDQSYWEEHPLVYIVRDDGCRVYKIFASYEVSTSGTTYRLGFKDDEAKQEFIDFGLSESVIDTGVVPTTDDLILTLSTCTGNGHATRWVVQAVLLGMDPK